jgi:hypothetical protein
VRGSGRRTSHGLSRSALSRLTVFASSIPKPVPGNRRGFFVCAL